MKKDRAMAQYNYIALLEGTDDYLDTFTSDTMFTPADIEGDVGRFSIDGRMRQCRLARLDDTLKTDEDKIIHGTIWVEPTGIEDYR